VHNLESQRRQYGLADRARQLGWATVEIIDDDLGRSGGGIARPGFERLLAAICDRRVGAVLAIEASRLARNGRDWHTLIEFCGLVGTILVDEDGIYDPRHPNDRLLLGMKGTMSELELSLFRQRSQEALRQMARRGVLVLGVAAGYVKVGRDRIEKNPDKRVQQAIQLVFTGPQSALVTTVSQFFDFVLTSSLIDQLSEYNVPNYKIGHGKRTGTVTITSPAPKHSESDAAIQAFLQAQIANNAAVPKPGPNTLYFIYARGPRQRIGRRRRRTRRPREPNAALDPHDPIARLPRLGPHRRMRGKSSSRLRRHTAHGSSSALCRSVASVGPDTPRLIRSPSFT
jgi:DNA invertase Pin-like site-specific DNA recombinase